MCGELDLIWEFDGRLNREVGYPVETLDDITYVEGNVHVIGAWTFQFNSALHYRLDAATGSQVDRTYWYGDDGERIRLLTIAANPVGHVFLGGDIDYESGSIGYAATFHQDNTYYRHVVGGRAVTAFGAGERYYAYAISSGDKPWIQLHTTSSLDSTFGRTGDALRTWDLPGRSSAVAVADDGTVYSTGWGHLLFRAGLIGVPTISSSSSGGATAPARSVAGGSLAVSQDDTVFGQVQPSDLKLAPGGSVFVTGTFTIDGSAEPNLYIARYAADGTEVWSWVITDADGGGDHLAVHPVLGTPYVAWSAPSGALRVAEFDASSGDVVDFRECTPQAGWNYDLRGFEVDESGSLYLSGNKPFTSGLPGGGRGFVFKARLD